MIDPLEGGLFDLPEYEHIQDEEFLPLPPPDSPGDNDDASLVNGEPEGNKLSQTKGASGTTRRVVRRPLPKLDAQRLVSERGLPALRSMFDNVKFKGKGHEEADLQTLIRHMEHWAHRLFPKLQFEEFVDRVERLGSKNTVQACLKRIRLDLPILHEDFPEEQQQRIERNRQIALERRHAKTQSNILLEEHEMCMTQPDEENNTILIEQQDVIAVEAGSVPFEATENL
uniref:TIMELESS-interacting protein n=1 Tax=Pogona vitticeps TaxID=103695 RepID=A0ABM5EY45_9SAUR